MIKRQSIKILIFLTSMKSKVWKDLVLKAAQYMKWLQRLSPNNKSWKRIKNKLLSTTSRSTIKTNQPAWRI